MDDSLSEGQIIAQWETAARKPGARSALHPSGKDVKAYEASGAKAADRITDFTVRYGRMNPELVRFLDYGCGDGRVMKVLQQRGLGVTGYDTSPTMLERAAENGCRVLVDSADDLAGDYSVVFAVSVLIHHDHDTGASLIRRLVDQARPDGLVIFTLPVHERERVRSGWIDVTVWSPDRLDRVLDSLPVKMLRSPRYPGMFTYAHSANNDTWHVLRKARETTDE